MCKAELRYSIEPFASLRARSQLAWPDGEGCSPASTPRSKSRRDSTSGHAASEGTDQDAWRGRSPLRICATVFELTSLHRARSRRRRLTQGRAEPRASTRSAECGEPESVGAMREVSFPAMAARKRGSPLQPDGKFSALQSLENSQNGKRISILRELVSQAGGTPRADAGRAPHMALLAPSPLCRQSGRGAPTPPPRP